MGIERTLFIVKPDAVGRNLTGRIIAHVEEKGSIPYQIRFLSDPTAQWQARSLQALRAFAPSLISIETP